MIHSEGPERRRGGLYLNETSAEVPRVDDFFSSRASSGSPPALWSRTPRPPGKGGLRRKLVQGNNGAQKHQNKSKQFCFRPYHHLASSSCCVSFMMVGTSQLPLTELLNLRRNLPPAGDRAPRIRTFQSAMKIGHARAFWQALADDRALRLI